jgi:hypothetical protein
MPDQKVEAAQKRTGKRQHSNQKDQRTKVRAHLSAPQLFARRETQNSPADESGA